jgi:hypothetical protein
LSVIYVNFSKQSFPPPTPVCEKREVFTKTDQVTGIITYEAWQTGGELDRMDGPAYIERDPATGTVTYEEWRKGGKCHRADGPARIERDAQTGTITSEAWYNKDGWADRMDGPAHIERDAATGIITYEGWWKDGESFEPSVEVWAVWLRNSGERYAVSAPSQPAPSP